MLFQLLIIDPIAYRTVFYSGMVTEKQAELLSKLDGKQLQAKYDEETDDLLDQMPDMSIVAFPDKLFGGLLKCDKDVQAAKTVVFWYNY